MKKQLAKWMESILERFRPLWNKIDRLFPANMSVPAKIGVILVLLTLLTLFALATPTLAAWSDRQLLPALSSMNIFALVEDLSKLTNQMVTETSGLEQEVEQAGKKLGALDRQEKLLVSQLDIHKGVQQELTNQLNGNIEARQWMKQILTREARTYDLTSQVSSQTGRISGQMSETIRQLKNVSVGMVQITENTQKMNGQMNLLLNELDQSIQNFHFLSRISDALRYLERITGLNLPLPRDSGSSTSPLPGKLLPKPSKPPVPLPDLPNLLKPKQKSHNNSSGILDLLLP